MRLCAGQKAIVPTATPAGLWATPVLTTGLAQQLRSGVLQHFFPSVHWEVPSVRLLEVDSRWQSVGLARESWAQIQEVVVARASYDRHH